MSKDPLAAKKASATSTGIPRGLCRFLTLGCTWGSGFILAPLVSFRLPMGQRLV